MEVSFDRDLDTQAFAYFNSQSCPSSIGETPSRNSRTQSASQSVLNHDRAHMKSMMSKVSIEGTGGYSDEKGHHYEAKVTMEFGEGRNKSENSRDRSDPNRESRDVKSADRD